MNKLVLENHESKSYFEPSQKKKMGGETMIFLAASILIFLTLMAIGVVWFNLSVNSGSFKGNTTINNQIEQPQQNYSINVDERDTNNYEHIINNNIEISGQLLDGIVDEIVEKVLEGLNETT